MLPICRKMTVVFLLRLARFCANSVASRPESFEVDEAATGSMRQSCRARETGGILTLIFRADGLPMPLRLLGQQFGAITIIPVHPKPGDAAICVFKRAGDHDCPRAASADIRLLPPHRLGRIDLRASRRVRHDAGYDVCRSASPANEHGDQHCRHVAERAPSLTAPRPTPPPKHGSWLNMAESELGVLASQCLDRRIADKQILAHEVNAWQDHRNKHHAKANWQFKTADARVKLKRLYPQFG
jgi:hypothetical protein